MPLTVETPRLILRQWKDSDLDPWAEMNADPRVMEFYPRVYDRARADEMAGWMRGELERKGYGWWAAELKETGRFIGVIAADDINYDVPFTPAREIAWRLAFDAWHHGYATEGAAAAVQFAFDRLGWDEVVAFTTPLNLPSERVMQRLGMTRDPAEDFGHPKIEPGHRLHRMILYRLKKR